MRHVQYISFIIHDYSDHFQVHVHKQYEPSDKLIQLTHDYKCNVKLTFNAYACILSLSTIWGVTSIVMFCFLSEVMYANRAAQ